MTLIGEIGSCESFVNCYPVVAPAVQAGIRHSDVQTGCRRMACNLSWLPVFEQSSVASHFAVVVFFIRCEPFLKESSPSRHRTGRGRADICGADRESQCGRVVQCGRKVYQCGGSIKHCFFVVCGRVCGDDTFCHSRARKCY